MSSILGRINLLFFLFFLLIAISVGATFWGLRAQAEDSLVINLAGRQRMLVQQMGLLMQERLALQSGDPVENRRALEFAIRTFDETLQALQHGGQVSYPADEPVSVPPAREAQVRQQLEQVEATWQGYRSSLEALLTNSNPGEPNTDALAAVQRLAPALNAEADAAVRLFQADSRQRANRLRSVQICLFLNALALMAASRVTLQRSIVTPLKRLNRSTERIRTGDLQTGVAVRGPQEVRTLAAGLETMRAELEQTQRELRRAAQELEDRVQQRTQELDALYAVAQEITSRLDSQEVLQSITGKARELLQAETSFLCLLDSDQQALNLQAISGPEETVLRTSASVRNPFVQETLSQPAEGPPCLHLCQGSCGILANGYRASHQAAALTVENRVIGALCVGHRQPGAFSDEHSTLLTRMASAAAVALENSRLYGQAERIAALEERQRIAAEMHDGLAQIIDYLGLLVDQAGFQIESGKLDQAEKTLSGARSRISQASVEVRRSIASLQDEPRQPKTIQEQLREVVREAARDGCSIQWSAELEGALVLPNEDAQQIVRIAQEALSNARRHSGAGHIQVRLVQSEAEACLTIADDGCGFDPAAAPGGERKHFGLKILQARAARIGGCLEVQSAPGAGTRIVLRWPVRKPCVPPVQAG